LACSGIASVSPGRSALNAMEPGPCAFIMISGIPASLRFQPPGIFSESSLTSVSACSSAWCEK
jgi:hypothetical protein